MRPRKNQKGIVRGIDKMSRQQILDSQVSFYKNHSDTAGEIRSLLGLCEDIKHGKWDRDILAMRQEMEGVTDEKERDRIKKIHKAKLSAFTGSGVFSKRNAGGLIKHSGMLFIDIDPNDNPILLEKFDEIRKQLTADKYTCILFSSCSGMGIAIGVKIDGTKQLETFQYLEQYYKEEYGLTIDKACKDVARLRYISYDKDLYYANGRTQLVTVPEGFLKESERGDTKPIPNANGKNHEIIRAIIASKILLGDDSYNSWLKIAFALAQEFGEAGRAYFHELSKISQKYDPAECDRKFDNCLKTNRGDVTFGTIIHLAKQAGIRIPTPDTYNPRMDRQTVLQWQEPDVDNDVSLPKFPLEEMPKGSNWLFDFAQAVAENRQTSLDMPSLVAITMVSIVSAYRKYWVGGKKNWIESTNIWTSIEMASGETKSAVMTDAKKPISELYAESKERAAKQNEGTRAAREAASAAYEKAKKKGNEVEIQEAINRLNRYPLVVPLQMITSDTTTEELVHLMDRNGGGMGIVSTEGGIFDIMDGRYGGDKKANIDPYLQGHAGEDIYRNRRGILPIYIPKARISICTAVQPHVIQGLIENKAMMGRGLLNRFIYSRPPVMQGTRKGTRYRREIPPNAIRRYTDNVKAIYNSANEMDCEKILMPSDEAWELLYDYQEKVEKELGFDGRLWDIGGWGSKLPSTVLRLAGLLHIIATIETTDDFCTLPISPGVMASAIAIGDYAIEHALSTFKIMGTDAETQAINKAVEWLKKKGFENISRREIQHRFWRLKKNELENLIKGLVSKRCLKASKSGSFRVSPALSSDGMMAINQ